MIHIKNSHLIKIFKFITFLFIFLLLDLAVIHADEAKVDQGLLRDYQRRQSTLKTRIEHTLFTIRTYDYNFRRRDRIIEELPEVEKNCKEKQELLNRDKTRLSELLQEEKDHMKDKSWTGRAWSNTFPDYKERFRRKKIDELKYLIENRERTLHEKIKKRDDMKMQLKIAENYLKRDKAKVAEKAKTFTEDIDKAREELKRIEKDIERIKNGWKPIHTDPSDYARKDKPKKKPSDPAVIPPIVATQSTKGNDESQKDRSAAKPPKFVDNSKKDEKKKSDSSKTTQKKEGKKPGFADKNKSLGKKGGSITTKKGWQPTGKTKGRTDLEKSADWKDYEIVSTLVKTTPVTYEGRNYQKLVDGNTAVIVLRNRGQDYIIEGTQALTILIEKGFFVHFPKVGLIATTRYDRLGHEDGGDSSSSGSGGASLFDQKMGEGCSADNPDNPCTSFQQKCAGVSLTPPQVPEKKKRRGDTGETIEQYWKRVWCKQEKKVCQEWLKNGCKYKRNEDFHKGFKTTPMSPDAAKVFGGALLPSK